MANKICICHLYLNKVGQKQSRSHQCDLAPEVVLKYRKSPEDAQEEGDLGLQGAQQTQGFGYTVCPFRVAWVGGLMEIKEN